MDLQEKKKWEKKREPLVPVGNSNRYLRVLLGIWVKKKVGRRAGVEPCPRSPNYRALPLRYWGVSFKLGQRGYKTKVQRALGTSFGKPTGTLELFISRPLEFEGTGYTENRYLRLSNGTGWIFNRYLRASLDTGCSFHPVP